MKTGFKQVFHIARITLEAVTPLSIVTGKASGVFDTSLVVDANGLPAIPGSGLAGVLRHLYQGEYDEQGADKLFGCQDRNKNSQRDNSQPSRLHVSWGCIQNERGAAIQGLHLGEQRKAIENDTILSAALALADIPANRDRVHISHKGVSANTGKFDRAVLPAGYRFSIELSMWSEAGEDTQWNQVLDLLNHPLCRLGGANRAGLGKMKVVSVHEKVTDLSSAEGRAAFRGMSRDMNDKTDFSVREIAEWQASTQADAKVVTAKITLQPNSYWRIGQGVASDKNGTDEKGKNAGLLPKLEQRISWRNAQQAEGAAEKLLIPASSVKGALSHRVAFHANRFSETSVWADDVLDESSAQYQKDYDKSEHCEAVRQLFGFANDAGAQQQGLAGRVLIDDAYREFSGADLQIIMHNSIDRFSGGVRDHMLFSEEMVWGKGIELQITIRTTVQHGNEESAVSAISDTARQALRAALEDLCQGRLALGAGVAKGHGLFSGEINWSDGGQWIEGQNE